MTEKEPAHKVIMEEIEDLSRATGNQFFDQVITTVIELFCDTLRSIIIPKEEISFLIERVEVLESFILNPDRQNSLQKLKKELERYKRELEKGEKKMTFLVEEMKRINGFWDPDSRRVLGYKEVSSAEKAAEELGAITTCCRGGLKLFVPRWKDNTKGWIITPIKKI